MRYKVYRTDEIDPKLDSLEWNKAEIGCVLSERWDGYHSVPETTFKLLRGPEGLSVLMMSAEKGLRAECTEENGMVCQDSCMEFFFKPDPWDTNYLNFEINPKGVMHLGLGDGRHGRRLIDTDRSVFSIDSRADDGNWVLKYYIPDSFLFTYFKNFATVCRANFYKCGDLTGHEHYGMWSEVEVPKPDFHVPDFFGFLEIVE